MIDVSDAEIRQRTETMTGRKELQNMANHLFHRLWGMGKDRSPYSKDLWVALQTVLFRLGVEV